MAINDYFRNLPREKKRIFMMEVCQACDMGVSTFYYKLKNGFRKIEEEVVYKIIENYGN